MGVYCEGSGSEIDFRPTTLTKPYVHLYKCRSATVRNAFSIPNAGTLLDTDVDVTDDGDGTSTVSNVSSALVAGLQAAGKVHLRRGGANDEDYTVDGASDNSLGISDGHFDESGMRCLGGNAARDAPIRVRHAPQVAIKLKACHNCEVNNVHFLNFRVAGVKLDSQSQHNRVSNHPGQRSARRQLHRRYLPRRRSPSPWQRAESRH
jgi:hypothetical protein